MGFSIQFTVQFHKMCISSEILYRVRRVDESVVDHGDEAVVHRPTVAPSFLLQESFPEEGEGDQRVTEEHRQTKQRHHQQ